MLDFSPSSISPGETTAVTGAVDGSYYYLFTPTGGLYGPVFDEDFPSDIGQATNVGSTPSFDDLVASEIDPYGTWTYCEMAAEGPPPDAACEGALSTSDYTWVSAEGGSPEFSGSAIAESNSALVATHLFPLLLVTSLVVTMMLALFTKGLRQEMH